MIYVMVTISLVLNIISIASIYWVAKALLGLVVADPERIEELRNKYRNRR